MSPEADPPYGRSACNCFTPPLHSLLFAAAFFFQSASWTLIREKVPILIGN